jgi:c-di-GMP-binding flagellar brake protein YcgR
MRLKRAIVDLERQYRLRGNVTGNMAELPGLVQGPSTNATLRPSQADRRRWFRSELDVRVRLSFQRDRVQQKCHCRSVDISEGGIGLIAPYEIDLGQALQIEFLLLPATPLQLRAVVRNRAGFRYGLEFLTLSAAQRQEIARFSSRVS